MLLRQQVHLGDQPKCEMSIGSSDKNRVEKNREGAIAPRRRDISSIWTM